MGTILKTTFLVFLCFVISGCAGIGPGKVPRDRFNYATALSDSWKSQMLLTIVMIRYGDSPVFLDVASIISQYSLETEVDGNLFWTSPPYQHEQEIGGSATYTDRPTITYTQLSGEAYARTLMKPIPVSAILNLINGGYSIDLVLRLGIHSINDIRNRHYGGSARERKADPEFYPLIEKMLRAQQAQALGLRLQQSGTETNILFVFRKTDDAGVQEDLRSIRDMLGLNHQAMEFTVLAGSIAKNDTEIAILTRSLSEILIDLGSDVHVPASHVDERRTSPALVETMEDGTVIDPLIHIHSSQNKPPDAFASVSYRGYWFWIDDKDLPSKQRFSFLRAVFALTETGGAQGAPIVTIPAG